MLFRSLIFGSCQKNHQESTSAITFQLQTQNAGTGTVQWTSGTAHVATVTAITPSATTSNYTSTVNQDINLFSPASIGNITLPTGAYQNIQFQLTMAPSATTSALHLEGTFNDGTNTVPVKLDIPDNTVLQVVDSSLAVAAGTGYKAIISIDLNKLTLGVAATDLASTEQNGEVEDRKSVV